MSGSKVSLSSFDVFLFATTVFILWLTYQFANWLSKKFWAGWPREVLDSIVFVLYTVVPPIACIAYFYTEFRLQGYMPTIQTLGNALDSGFGLWLWLSVVALLSFWTMGKLNPLLRKVYLWRWQEPSEATGWTYDKKEWQLRINIGLYMIIAVWLLVVAAYSWIFSSELLQRIIYGQYKPGFPMYPLSAIGQRFYLIARSWGLTELAALVFGYILTALPIVANVMIILVSALQLKEMIAKRRTPNA